MTTFTTQREIAAEPTDVFSAVRDPDRLARWWGPDGFTNRFKTFEFRPGGQWAFDMVGPDGTVYPNESRFSRIEDQQLVEIQHVCQPNFTLTVTLSPSPVGTLVLWEQAFEDDAVAHSVRHIVEPSNEQNLDRLTQEVQRLAQRAG